MNRSVETIDRSITNLKIVKTPRKAQDLVVEKEVEKRISRVAKTVTINIPKKCQGEIRPLTVFMPRNGLSGLL